MGVYSLPDGMGPERSPIAPAGDPRGLRVIPFIYPVMLRVFVCLHHNRVVGDFCFISLLGRATYLWAEDRYELHVVKYSKPNRKR